MIAYRRAKMPIDISLAPKFIGSICGLGTNTYVTMAPSTPTTNTTSGTEEVTSDAMLTFLISSFIKSSIRTPTRPKRERSCLDYFSNYLARNSTSQGDWKAEVGGREVKSREVKVSGRLAFQPASIPACTCFGQIVMPGFGYSIIRVRLISEVSPTCRTLTLRFWLRKTVSPSTERLGDSKA